MKVDVESFWKLVTVVTTWKLKVSMQVGEYTNGGLKMRIKDSNKNCHC